ncbi:MAG: tetratricopeptide repeat protein [Magnetococcales bacterium]|nr:tetratricopeptide repeat protein [Magnetococcales bacterium]
MTDSRWVVDVDGASFASEVLERSRRTPVLVDFWANWCGPCRTLGPILAKLAEELQGRFVLAKIDSDRNPDLARRYGVRGIPAVKLFIDGQVTNEFTGALPESRVRKFLEESLPSGADKAASQAMAALTRGDLQAAEAGFAAVLTQSPEHTEALLGLTRVYLDSGRMEEANATLARLPARDREGTEAKLLAARLAFAAAAVDIAPLAARVEADPADLAARMALGEALVARESYAEGLEQFLEVVRRNRAFDDDAGRKAILRVFDLLGPGHPLIASFRPRLSALLFS